MDRMIYTAMTGAKALMQRQEALSQQPRQRRHATAFGPTWRRSAPCRCVPDGTADHARVVRLEATTGVDPRAGPISRPAAILDVAIEGAGWIAVQDARRHRRPTRATAAWQVGDEGMLQHARGARRARRRRADHRAAGGPACRSAATARVSAEGRRPAGRWPVGTASSWSIRRRRRAVQGRRRARHARRRRRGRRRSAACASPTARSRAATSMPSTRWSA